MVFTEEDCILIEQLSRYKVFGARKIVSEFPQKGWQVRSVSRLLQKLRETGTTSRAAGSGRPRTTKTENNIDAVEELVLNEEDAPRTHRSTRQIARHTGIHRSSVARIIHDELKLRCFKRKRAQQLTEANRVARHTRSKKLLRKFSKCSIDFIFFSDEKILTTDAQNDRVYPPVTTKKTQINVCALDPHSASQSWYHWPSRSSAAASWCLLIPEQKSMVPIIEKNCCRRSCCLPSAASLAMFMRSSKTTP